MPRLQALSRLFKKIFFLRLRHYEISCIIVIYSSWNYVLTDLYNTIVYSSSYIAVFENYCIFENGTKLSISENGMITTEISNFVPL